LPNTSLRALAVAPLCLELFGATEEIARADGSAGWCMLISNAISTFVHRVGPRTAKRPGLLSDSVEFRPLSMTATPPTVVGFRNTRDTLTRAQKGVDRLANQLSLLGTAIDHREPASCWRDKTHRVEPPKLWRRPVEPLLSNVSPSAGLSPRRCSPPHHNRDDCFA